MPYRLTLSRSPLRSAMCLAVLLAAPALAAAQQVIDPHVIEFAPAPGPVTSYQAEISVAGTAQVLQLITLGLPALQADGLIRTDLASHLTGTPVPGLAYVSRIVTTGPLGTATSPPSNPFTFSSCGYRLATAGVSLPAAAGTGAVDVQVTGTGCTWTATSSAPWLTLGSTPAGRTVAFAVTRHTGATPRTATLAIGPGTYTVTQNAEVPRTVSVATAAQLQAAVAAVTTNTTVVLEPGLYRVTATLHLTGPLAGVVLKGRTGRAADVVLDGPGMTIDGGVPTALWVTGAVQGLEVRDLTIQHFAHAALRFDAGPQAPHLANLHLLDTGDALIQTTASATAPGVDDGLLENSSLEYTTTGARATAGGLDLRGAHRWTVRGNAFRNVRGPGRLPAFPAVSASASSSDTLVEGNLFVNCQVGIALGLTHRAGSVDHRGGRITNNFIYRAPLVPGGPGISVVDSPDTLVLHNTVITSQTAAATIEYRFSETTHLVVANNLVDGPILALDNAWAVQTGNLTNATPDLFVYAAGGDLHLRRTATLALDMADPSASVPADIDGQPRALDRGNDVGADEVNQGTEPPTVQLGPPPAGPLTAGTALAVHVLTGAATPIAFVDLYVNAVVIARLTTAPYDVNLSLPQAGAAALVAVAVDTTGGRTASAPLTLTISE